MPAEAAALVVQTVWGQVSPLTGTQAGIEPWLTAQQHPVQSYSEDVSTETGCNSVAT
jgi:hypothetical protein